MSAVPADRECGKRRQNNDLSRGLLGFPEGSSRVMGNNTNVTLTALTPDLGYGLQVAAASRLPSPGHQR